MKKTQVLVIGAGPAGSLACAYLKKAGIGVLCVDKEVFPRFVIGESLLPFCMNMLEEAGLLEAVNNAGFQFKNGAAFSRGLEYCYFDFCDKSSNGYGTTYQVQRAIFDKLLIDTVSQMGVDVSFGVAVEKVDFPQNSLECPSSISYNANTPPVKVTLNNNEIIEADFIIDASGYGRVLPRLLNLESPSNLSPKKAFFTHIEDKISEPLYDRKKILITTHPNFYDVWFWLIPFSNGRCSIGVVGEEKTLTQGLENKSDEEILKTHVYTAPMLKRLLDKSIWDTPVRNISSYSKNVKQLYGNHFILLGNAGEFLDPVFSSGVTIAMYAAKLARDCLVPYFKGENVPINEIYAKELMLGVNAFRTYVMGWYDGKFQDVIYTRKENQHIKRMICSILAGYAWDKKNPYVTRSNQALEALWHSIKSS